MSWKNVSPALGLVWGVGQEGTQRMRSVRQKAGNGVTSTGGADPRVLWDGRFGAAAAARQPWLCRACPTAPTGLLTSGLREQGGDRVLTRRVPVTRTCPEQALRTSSSRADGGGRARRPRGCAGPACSFLYADCAVDFTVPAELPRTRAAVSLRKLQEKTRCKW